MDTEAELRDCLQAVRAYTARHPALRDAHHFLFDLRHCPIDQVQYVVMGQNPGIGRHDLELCVHGEESSEYDFRSTDHAIAVTKKARQAMKWTKMAVRILGGSQFAQTERFFWSSSDLAEAFREQFKTTFRESPHLDFCNSINKRLIGAYNPAAVVCPGLTGMKTTIVAFELDLQNTLTRAGKRLVVRLRDKQHRPWFFTPNWTGARGLSDSDKRVMAEAIQYETRQNR